jgi:FKBP-type peptidyl-prolyl cis-trans isomerase
MNKGILAGIVIAIIAAVGLLVISQTSSSSTPVATTPPTEISPSAGGNSVLCASQPPALTGVKDADVKELKLEDKMIGSGAEAVSGKAVVMNYIGRLTDGTQFDTSCGKPAPFDFVLGQGRVIQGWDQGIVGMKVGGIRRLIIPASLGYGAAGAGGVIPPNAALVFDVELIEVK